MILFIVQKEQMICLFKQERMVSITGKFAVGNDMALKDYTRCIYLILFVLFTLCGYEMQLHSDCASDAINCASLFAKMSTKWPIRSGKGQFHQQNLNYKESI